MGVHYYKNQVHKTKSSLHFLETKYFPLTLWTYNFCKKCREYFIHRARFYSGITNFIGKMSTWEKRINNY